MTWILLNRKYPDAAKAKAIRGLFTWCLREGQAYAPDLNFVPLPPPVVAKAVPVLHSIMPAE
jgi:phosphate transport system substrate-binding protein